MQIETFFGYKNYRWLWVNLALLIVLVVIYAIDRPIGGRNGGTIVGYTYGALATAGILYLMWYGIRKRAYHSRRTTLRGCLAAHVWLGIALAIIVPLHAGFQFGINVHTLAYVLMMAVVLSGIWGAVNYASLAPDIESHRGGGNLKKLIEQLHIISQNIDALCAPRSDTFAALRNYGDFEFNSALPRVLAKNIAKPLSQEKLGELIAALPEAEKEDGLNLVSLLDKKRDFAERIQSEARVMTKLRFWLYLHLPISLALVLLVAIHIFVVLYYRG